MVTALRNPLANAQDAELRSIKTDVYQANKEAACKCPGNTFLVQLPESVVSIAKSWPESKYAWVRLRTSRPLQRLQYEGP